MSDNIRFRRNDKKMLEMIVFIASLAGERGVNTSYLARIFFEAERWHLDKLMRPIVGDVYIKLPQGPVPVGVLDLIHGNEAMGKELLVAAKHALEVIHNGEKHIRARRKPDMEYFSESDHVGLRRAYALCSIKSLDALRGDIYQEPAWCKAVDGQKISYADMLGEHPDKAYFVQELEEEGPFIGL